MWDILMAAKIAKKKSIFSDWTAEPPNNIAKIKHFKNYVSIYIELYVRVPMLISDCFDNFSKTSYKIIDEKNLETIATAADFHLFLHR